MSTGGPFGRGGTSELPDAATLAQLVSNVTRVSCGATFTPADDAARGESICGRMVLMPFRGERDISVVLSCDGAGARALAAGLRRADPRELTRQMIDDSIGEFLSMVSGQVQRALQIDQPLGLPRPTTLAEIAEKTGVGLRDSILLTSQGLSELSIWVFETDHSSPEAALAPRKGPGKFWSLFRKQRHRD